MPNEAQNQYTTKPLLSSTIDFAQEIAPNPMTMILAGIGAGKNTFAEHLMTGSPQHNIPKKSVLLITSRKSKVLETISNPNCDITRIIGRSNKPQNSVICTNAYIQAYMQHFYNPVEPATHLWNRFDVIIVDEAHALVTDSTYQSAPAQVASLIQETYRRIRQAKENAALSPEAQNPTIQTPTCQNIILMTGTPEPLRNVPFLSHAKILDRRDVCRNVMPQNIHLIDQCQAKRKIREQLQAGDRVLYFTNHIVSAEILAETYCIPVEQVVSSFSDEQHLRSLKTSSDAWKACPENKDKESVYERMLNTQNHLATHSCIRSDIKLFVTTGKNKEGININDTDIQHVYVESHCMTDIRQMFGRVRHGVQHAYVITNSPGYNFGNSDSEQWLTAQLCDPMLQPQNSHDSSVSILNQLLKTLCSQQAAILQSGKHLSEIRMYDDAWPLIGERIDFLLKKFPYCQFDFLTNSFSLNELHVLGDEYFQQDISTFYHARSSPEDLSQLFQANFPYAMIHPPKSNETEAREYLESLLQSHGTNQFDSDTFTQIIGQLATFFPDSSTPHSNRILHRIGYEARRVSNNRQHSKHYNEYRIISLSAHAETVSK